MTQRQFFLFLLVSIGVLLALSAVATRSEYIPSTQEGSPTVINPPGTPMSDDVVLRSLAVSATLQNYGEDWWYWTCVSTIPKRGVLAPGTAVQVMLTIPVETITIMPPILPFPPTSQPVHRADLDNDNDVDLMDMRIFQECFNGPNRPPACPEN